MISNTINKYLYIFPYFSHVNYSGILSCPDIPEPDNSFRLPFAVSGRSCPSVYLNKTSMIMFNYNLDQCILYSLWPNSNKKIIVKT